MFETLKNNNHKRVMNNNIKNENYYINLLEELGDSLHNLGIVPLSPYKEQKHNQITEEEASMLRTLFRCLRTVARENKNNKNIDFPYEELIYMINSIAQKNKYPKFTIEFIDEIESDIWNGNYLKVKENLEKKKIDELFIIKN